MKLVEQTKPLVDPISGRILSPGSHDHMDRYLKEVGELGYDNVVALATEAEVRNGSACGQLAMIVTEGMDEASAKSESREYAVAK